MYQKLQKCITARYAWMVLLAPLPAVAAGCPGADSDALAWLDRMSRSIHQVSYSGVVTFQRGEDMQVMQVTHLVEDGSSTESLTQLTGQGARVMRTDHPLECIHPGHKLLRVGSELQQGRCGVAQHYRFSIEDGERVAGRHAVNVRIQPLDMYRFGYLMALDSETGLLLKTETLGRGDKVLEQFQFASLSYADSAEEPGGAELVHQAQHPHPGAGSREDTRAWTINWLPQGFAPTDKLVAGASRQTYTDGLAVFSVFLEQLGREIRPGEGVARNGSTTSYTRGLQLAGNPVLVTVIGEVPVNTARMVADSVAWAP